METLQVQRHSRNASLCQNCLETPKTVFLMTQLIRQVFVFPEIVNRMIGDCVHNMVHYDITCYKQLYIQVKTTQKVMNLHLACQMSDFLFCLLRVNYMIFY